jgi:hypothetical protein
MSSVTPRIDSIIAKDDLLRAYTSRFVHKINGIFPWTAYDHSGVHRGSNMLRRTSFTSFSCVPDRLSTQCTQSDPGLTEGSYWTTYRGSVLQQRRWVDLGHDSHAHGHAASVNVESPSSTSECVFLVLRFTHPQIPHIDRSAYLVLPCTSGDAVHPSVHVASGSPRTVVVLDGEIRICSKD